MQSKATTVEQYLDQLPEERKEAMNKLRDLIKANIPEGFEECISYGMIGYVVPHSLYPSGYHVNNKLPLPFINLASQKNFIAIYHSGIYTDPNLMNWFVEEYGKRVKTKLDMGKSCIRLKNVKHIPYDLIAELATKMTTQEWIDLYESKLKR